MAVAQHPRVAGERPVRAGGGGHVAGADWWTGPAGWRVGVAPVSRVAVRLSLLLKELAKARPPSPNCAMSSIQCSGLLFVCFKVDSHLSGRPGPYGHSGPDTGQLAGTAKVEHPGPPGDFPAHPACGHCR